MDAQQEVVEAPPVEAAPAPNYGPYPEEFLRQIAQKMQTPEGEKLVAAVPRYEVGEGPKKWTVPVSQLEQFLNTRTLQGGRLVTILPQGSGLTAPVFLFHDQFVLPEEVDTTIVPEPEPVAEDDAARQNWEAGSNE